jgi:hypothetical protein
MNKYHFRSKSTNTIDNENTKKQRILEHKIDFSKINIIKCSILSLKNQLKSAASIDELTVITSKIIDLEQSIADEKLAGYQQLNITRRILEAKLSGMPERSKVIEYELNRVTLTLIHKLNGYKKVLDKKIDTLHTDYDELQKNIIQ